MPSDGEPWGAHHRGKAACTIMCSPSVALFISLIREPRMSFCLNSNNLFLI